MRTLNRDAADVLRPFAPNAVTDVTGFGLLGHAHEMATRSGVRIVLDGRAAAGARRRARRRARGRARRAATRATASSPARTSTRTACRTSSSSSAYDPQTAGGLLVSLPARQGAGARGGVRAAPASSCARIGRVEAGAGRARCASPELDVAAGCDVGAAAARRGCAASRLSRGAFRRLAVATVGDARRDRRHRRDRAADRLRARLRALAGLPAGNPFPSRRATTRYIEFGNRWSRSSRSLVTLAAWLARSRRGSRAGSRGSPATLRRHARAGAARRDHGPLPSQPVARDLALPALGRSCCGSASSLALEASRARGRRDLAAACGCRGVGLARRARRARPHRQRARSRPASGPHPGQRRSCAGSGRFQPAVYWHVRATAVFGDLVRAAARLARRATRAPRTAARCARRCSGCSRCRWRSARCSTARTCRGGSCSST